jgi:hypothetical protein
VGGPAGQLRGALRLSTQAEPAGVSGRLGLRGLRPRTAGMVPALTAAARLPLGASRLRAAGGARRQSGLAAVRWEDGVAHSTFPAIDLRIPATTRLTEYCMRNFDRNGDKVAVVDGVTGRSGAGGARASGRPPVRARVRPRLRLGWLHLRCLRSHLLT